MAAYTTEQEQLQLIRDWFKKYGVSILLGIIIAAIFSIGWRYWQQNRIQKLNQAAALYEQLLVAQMTHQDAPALDAANNLIKNYPHTAYASFAGLFLSEQNVTQNDLAKAEQQLQNVINHSSDKTLQQLAKIRLARLWVAENKPKAALDLLNTIKAGDIYATAAAIISGDAYAALQQPQQAKNNYQIALNNLPASAPLRPIVQMKLDNLSD